MEARSVAEPAVELQSIRKTFASHAAVDGIDLAVPPGEFLTLLGPSGCGKSTTLNLIAGFLQPDSGAIRLAGRSVVNLPPFRRDIGIVFQDYALFPHMTVGQNVAFGLRMRKIGRREIERRVEEALELVQLSGFLRRRPGELRGGQRHRVALARALVIRPTVLLLHEPLSNLDLKLREEMRVEIAGLQRRLGITTVFVTHDQGEALVMSDRVAVMNAGRIEQVGSPSDIYERPTTRFVAEFIGRMNFFAEGGRPVAIRPERARLSTQAPADGFARRGTVKQVLYLGGALEYRLELADGERAVVEVPNDGAAPRYAEGSAVWFSASRESCYEIPARRP